MVQITDKSLKELRLILKEEFGMETCDKELYAIAYSLLGYFELLGKIYSRMKFGNNQTSLIDRKTNKNKDNN